MKFMTFLRASFSDAQYRVCEMRSDPFERNRADEV